ncbi:MAG: hypothetical protein H6581_11835 [Bacteroidia bacterium]|nr:hypothetical protein [Bacteroidia bacterium]
MKLFIPYIPVLFCSVFFNACSALNTHSDLNSCFKGNWIFMHEEDNLDQADTLFLTRFNTASSSDVFLTRMWYLEINDTATSLSYKGPDSGASGGVDAQGNPWTMSASQGVMFMVEKSPNGFLLIRKDGNLQFRFEKCEGDIGVIVRE